MDGALILNSSRGGAVSDKAITGEEARAFRKELSVCCTSQTGTTLQFLYFSVEANVLPITFLYYETVSALMHHINNNNNKAPVNMSNLFQTTSNIHSYNTRSSTSEKFYVKSSRLEIQNNSFSRLGVKLWNKIPSYITTLPKKAFKRIVRKLLFDVLEMEDDYIEISLIIKKLRH